MKPKLLATVLAFGALSAFAGSDGPCPVPDLHSDFVSAKVFHQTRDPVRDLQAFEAEKRVLVRTEKGDARLIDYGGGSCQSTATDAFAVFADPKVVIPLASLRPRPLPMWFDEAQAILTTSNQFFGTIEEPAILGNRYQIYKVADAGASPTKACLTPVVPGLRPSKGSVYPMAYFHSVVRAGSGKSHITLFRMNVESCQWQQEESFDEKVKVKDLDDLIRFPKQVAVMIVTDEGVLWIDKGRRNHYDLSPKEVVLLAPNLPVVLVRNQADDLQLFFPQRPGVSTFLRDAVDFNSGLVSYSPKGSQLFVAGSAQGEDHFGVYELKLKLPLR